MYRFLLVSLCLLFVLCGLSVYAAENTDMIGSFQKAKWIWYPSGDPADSVPKESVYFRKTVILPADKVIEDAVLGITCDDAFELYINGSSVGNAEGWNQINKYDIKKYLHQGKNVIAVVGINSSESAAGLLCKVAVKYVNSKSILVIMSDKSWKCSFTVTDGWQNIEYSDKTWKNACEAASAGNNPWGSPDWMGLPDMAQNIPSDFPVFSVPGYNSEMELVRRFYWQFHKGAESPAGATQWDAWMVAPTIAPAVKTGRKFDPALSTWKKALENRYIDKDGYVSTHQHISHTHDLGWPFPLWTQAYDPAGGHLEAYGWHFNDDMPAFLGGWREALKGNGSIGQEAVDRWSYSDLKSDGIVNRFWSLTSTGSSPVITSPKGYSFDSFCAPFLQMRFSRNPVAPDSARCYVEWMREGDSDFAPERRIEFTPNGINPWTPDSPVRHCIIKMYDNPLWNGRITRIRFNLAPGETGVKFNLDSIFTAFDTRHSINNSSFIIGCSEYFNWSGDIDFLRKNISRLRTAMKFNLDELGAEKYKLIKCEFPGHDGRAGYTLLPNGTRISHYGHGIGSNYWDLLPIGNEELYGTTYYYKALSCMAEIENAIQKNPKWGIPADGRLSGSFLQTQSAEVKEKANERFWNDQTGRFIACIDADGKPHDYGYTFINLEAIAYGLANKTRSASILNWIDGVRIVEGDTSTGRDIYHWKFAPRSTTLRNSDWYCWVWLGDTVPWETQVQDGGAVLGFSYHDLMARLNTNGPDDAVKRFDAIMEWYREVMAAGGPRKYYRDPAKGGTLQGGGTAGGLGIDFEFVESIMVPYFMLDGFLGFHPLSDGLEIKPNLPSKWPSLKVSNIAYKGSVLTVEVSHSQIAIKTGKSLGKIKLYLRPGSYSVSDSTGTSRITKVEDNGYMVVKLAGTLVINQKNK